MGASSSGQEKSKAKSSWPCPKKTKALMLVTTQAETTLLTKTDLCGLKVYVLLALWHWNGALPLLTSCRPGCSAHGGPHLSPMNMQIAFHCCSTTSTPEDERWCWKFLWEEPKLGSEHWENKWWSHWGWGSSQYFRGSSSSCVIFSCQLYVWCPCWGLTMSSVADVKVQSYLGCAERMVLLGWGESNGRGTTRHLLPSLTLCLVQGAGGRSRLPYLSHGTSSPRGHCRSWGGRQHLGDAALWVHVHPQRY